jgi:hypothetical protein
VKRSALVIAVAFVGAIGWSAPQSNARQTDYFSARIRDAPYGSRAFHVSAEATFSLEGCYWSTCDEVVQATFELRRKGRVVSQKEAQTYPRTSSLRATLPTFAKCRRPGPLTLPHQTVYRSYLIVMEATAYTGQTVTDTKSTFIVCRRR